MKKLLLFSFVLLFVSSLFSAGIAEYNEEMGIDTNSKSIVHHARTTREIPEGGLLLIPDSSGDRVMAFDPITGDLYDADFIPSDPTNLATPIAAALHPDGNSILVSDQVNDGVLQYDLDGNFMGFFAPAGGVNNDILDNVRGWSLKADGNILVTTASGTNTDAIAEFDDSGNYISNFIANGAGGIDGPFCVLYRETQDDYLVTTSTSDGVYQFDNAGTFITNLIPVINFGEQITETSSGNLLIAGFSTPSGCHEYTSDGTFVGLYDVQTGLRGAYELPNGNILVTNSSGVFEINRSNAIVSTKIEGVNARFIYFVEGDSGTTLDPPENVSVDDELGIISWYPPANTLIFDDFEAYLPGDYLAEVSTNWTTWSNLPGSAEDGVISDAYALSPTNSLSISGTNDQVLVMDNYTSGIYSMEVNLYVPTGNSGYWNLQKTNTIGEEWAFQILFETDGTATADAGAAAALVFTYAQDTWINMVLVVDLNADWCDIYVDGNLEFGYQWTLGTFGTPGLLSLGGMNLFASGLDPMCYYDDIKFKELVPATDDLLGYNVYLDNVMQNTGVVTGLEYTYTGLVGGVTYIAGVSAVYDEGESDIIEVDFTCPFGPYFDPPTNTEVTVVDYNDVELTWEAPGGDNLRSLSGYKIYQDGAEIAEITNSAILIYTDECLDAGTYEYTITAIYTYPPGESDPTAPVTAEIVLNPPANVDVQSQPPNIVITWEAPARSLDNYNVYNDGVLLAEGVTGTMYIDVGVPTGTFIYQMTAVYCGGYESDFSPEIEVVHVDGDDILKPTVTALTGNYPNPFNPTTTISFSIREAGHVSVNIYNMRGQLVKTLVNSELENDYYEIVWTGRDNSNKSVASGVYFYKMKTQNYNSTKKMILMK